MKVQFALCAQTASVDRASNRLSIFNVIVHISTPSLPLVLPLVTFFTILETERDEPVNLRGVFQVIANNVVVIQGEVPVSFVNSRLARVIVNVSSVPIREHGTLSFRLTIADEATAEVTLQVVNLGKIPTIPQIPVIPSA
jgi:hypothetical protein